ncbi:hypothetical protein EV421DRAFT_1745328 [Armillaria borealis]|uniref:DNase I-like protein n=1 Tax=Armillaria borealis TaxID=47425 RepID=A0AA39IUV6_9AGAR|nr:hypothetical protein EV421DRAFT_1745328 [Armillaria borealis]
MHKYGNRWTSMDTIRTRQNKEGEHPTGETGGRALEYGLPNFRRQTVDNTSILDHVRVLNGHTNRSNTSGDALEMTDRYVGLHNDTLPPPRNGENVPQNGVQSPALAVNQTQSNRNSQDINRGGQSGCPASCQGSNQCSKKSTKAAIMIASLNIRGYGSKNLEDKESRWLHINQIMREEKIGVLAVQEAHLNDE